MQAISLLLSIIALMVSLLTIWLTVLRRGSVRSTHPSIVAFSYDFVDSPLPQAKVFLRTLLYSTGKRGIVIENLFLRVSEGTRSDEFAYWGYGDKVPVRGSGIFVPETSVVTYHHFSSLNPDKLFWFTEGTYTLELIARIVGRKRLVSLWTIELTVPAVATSIRRGTRVFFNSSPEDNSYKVTVEKQSAHNNILSDST